MRGGLQTNGCFVSSTCRMTRLSIVSIMIGEMRRACAVGELRLRRHPARRSEWSLTAGSSWGGGRFVEGPVFRAWKQQKTPFIRVMASQAFPRLAESSASIRARSALSMAYQNIMMPAMMKKTAGIKLYII